MIKFIAAVNENFLSKVFTYDPHNPDSYQMQIHQYLGSVPSGFQLDLVGFLGNILIIHKATYFLRITSVYVEISTTNMTSYCNDHFT